MYRSDLNSRDKGGAIAAVIAIHAALLFAFLHLSGRMNLGDPQSAVSQLVKERGGYDLMPEFGYKPVNKYLPPRPRKDQTTAQAAAAEPIPAAGSRVERFFAWVDQTLSN